MCTDARLRSAAPAHGCARQLVWKMRQARNGDFQLESGPAPDPTPGICGAAELAEVDDGVGLVALNAIVTQDDFKNMAKPQTGGKAACQKQRELRTRLLATADVREADRTASHFDWKAVLKSLLTGAHIVGTGFASLLSAC